MPQAHITAQMRLVKLWRWGKAEYYDTYGAARLQYAGRLTIPFV